MNAALALEGKDIGLGDGMQVFGVAEDENFSDRGDLLQGCLGLVLMVLLD